MTTKTPEHYRLAQIILHWVVVVGIVVQLIIKESIVRVTDALSNGVSAESFDTILAWTHVGVGTTVLLAVLARFYLRFKYGVPDHAPGTSPKQAKLANAMHWALYTMLLVIVLTGMITWNGLAPLGQVHFIANMILFALIVGHAGAAIYNTVVRKDGTLGRMKLSRKS